LVLETVNNRDIILKRLGCNALHILPFLASPLVDAGFDVSDYMRVRDDLGTMEDMKNVVHEAQRLGIRLFMDLVSNHVSEEHEWFQKAQAGDEKYRRYFIVQKTRPRFVGKFHKDSAVWARYIVNGEVRDVNIAFPEMAGEIPHWRERKDGYWYYHTYYPQQLPSGVFAATYRFGISELLVFVNITDKPQSVRVNLEQYKDYTIILRFHDFEYGEDEITLGPFAGVWLQK
jgi:glycosidase